MKLTHVTSKYDVWRQRETPLRGVRRSENLKAAARVMPHYSGVTCVCVCVRENCVCVCVCPYNAIKGNMFMYMYFLYKGIQYVY